MYGPSPDSLYPLAGEKKLVFLKNLVKHPNIIIGDYTYYHDWENPENFLRNVLYHFDFEGDRLIIGKFCAIASEVKFIMNGANHRTDWLTNYPFPIFAAGWEVAMPESWPNKGDTIVGNDVWIGYDALIMPGVHIGDGAIIGSRSVVTRDVSPYSIVGGNPAQEIRKRFSEEVIEELLTIAWWDWPIEKITQHLKAICSSNLEALAKYWQQIGDLPES
jgi:virginiamycin A acetyltransferase